MKIIKKYRQVQSQYINFDKFSLFTKRFDRNVRHQMKHTIVIHNEKGMDFYLEVSEDINISKCKLFAYLKERLLNKMNRWTCRWLSKRGKKKVPIKSILLTLPTYVMSNFLLRLEI